MESTAIKCDGNVSPTVDFAGSDTVSLQDKLTEPEGFTRGATWAFGKMAAWLETTNIVADDQQWQRAVDQTKLLIAEQARLAAANLRAQK